MHFHRTNEKLLAKPVISQEFYASSNRNSLTDFEKLNGAVVVCISCCTVGREVALSYRHPGFESRHLINRFNERLSDSRSASSSAASTFPEVRSPWPRIRTLMTSRPSRRTAPDCRGRSWAPRPATETATTKMEKVFTLLLFYSFTLILFYSFTLLLL